MRGGDLQAAISSISNSQPVRSQAVQRQDVVPREAALEAQKQREVLDKSINRSEEPEKSTIQSDQGGKKGDSGLNERNRTGEEELSDEGSKASMKDQFRGHILDVKG